MTRIHRITPATALAVLLFGALGPLSAEPEPFDVREFRAVDTSRLLGSPDPLPPLEIVRAFPNLEFVRPVAIAHAGDGSGRIFVCDQPGTIWVFPDDEAVKEARVFLDIREKTRTSFFEEGLLGLAFHPRFEENGELFVYYSTDPQNSIISRFRVSSEDPSRADPASEEVLLNIPQPYGNHNGGGIEFGPDGMLYIPLGDGGKANDPHHNGQNLTTLLGSILRIDVDRRDPGLPYAIPADNPFVGEAGQRFGDGVRGEIWAYGLRNPWRMTFDRLTGELWAADVGQNLWEEINVIVKGGNYGWNVREGKHAFEEKAPTTGEPFIEPILEYARTEGKSITGGYVYRGKRFPELYGAYFYGDFVTFNIWALRYDGKQVSSNHLIARSSLPVSAFGETEEGELYLAAFSAAAGQDVKRLNAGQVFNLQRGHLYRFERRAAPDVDTRDFPRFLSQTGLFSDLPSHTMAPGVIPYDVNVPLWSDGAAKQRFVALPEKGSITFDESGQWQFPVGTVFVKTFSLPRDDGGEQRLETRLLVRSDRGWDGYTYLWHDNRTDARLLDSAVTFAFGVDHGTGPERQRWYFPSRSDCNACHTQVAGFVLGFNTRQLNRPLDYGSVTANQLDVLRAVGAFANAPSKPAWELESYPSWADASAPHEDLARAYLDVNCAVCHAPGGTGLAKADLRFHTPLVDTQLVDQVPGQRRFASVDSRLIAPGDPDRSELLLRMLTRGPGRMPTLASSRIDWRAVAILGEWIEELRR